MHDREDEERFEREQRIELELERTDLEILHELERLERPRLSTIKVVFTHAPTAPDENVHLARPVPGTNNAHPTPKGALMFSAVQGPAILTAAGQVATATVLGFDQTGAPMPAGFVMPIAAYSSDDVAAAIVISKDNGDGTDTITAVADGVAHITAELITAEGKTLTDVESVTVAIVVTPPPPPPTPVLSSIKIAFSMGPPVATAAIAGAAKKAQHTGAPA